jgi:hypothetical protein
MKWMRLLTVAGICSVTAFSTLSVAREEAKPAPGYPAPSESPVSWELDHQLGNLRRIVVNVPGESAPKAYWYLTYVVTNHSDKEQLFLPVFEMVTKEGKVIRSNTEGSAAVFQAIARQNEKMPLKPIETIQGTILLGEDQAKYSVAIWEEPDREMGSINIYIAGLSGETAPLRDADGNVITTKDEAGNDQPIMLRKTKQLDYTVRGDDRYAGDPVLKTGETWVMR